MVKNLHAMQETWIWFLGWEDYLGGRHSNPLPYSCLKNPHGQRSLAGYSPWGCKELDRTEWLITAQHKTILVLLRKLHLLKLNMNNSGVLPYRWFIWNARELICQINYIWIEPGFAFYSGAFYWKGKVQVQSTCVGSTSKLWPELENKNSAGVTLMVQWLRICLPMQRTLFQSIIWKLRFHMPQGN